MSHEELLHLIRDNSLVPSESPCMHPTTNRDMRKVRSITSNDSDREFSADTVHERKRSSADRIALQISEAGKSKYYCQIADHRWPRAYALNVAVTLTSRPCNLVTERGTTQRF
jgi:hypothetical protein